MLDEPPRETAQGDSLETQDAETELVLGLLRKGEWSAAIRVTVSQFQKKAPQVAAVYLGCVVSLSIGITLLCVSCYNRCSVKSNRRQEFASGHHIAAHHDYSRDRSREHGRYRKPPRALEHGTAYVHDVDDSAYSETDIEHAQRFRSDQIPDNLLGATRDGLWETKAEWRKQRKKNSKRARRLQGAIKTLSSVSSISPFSNVASAIRMKHPIQDMEDCSEMQELQEIKYWHQMHALQEMHCSKNECMLASCDSHAPSIYSTPSSTPQIRSKAILGSRRTYIPSIHNY